MSGVADELIDHICRIRILCFLEKPGAGDCDGSRCGCYKQYCWAYTNSNHTTKDDWWCYTQKAGVKRKQNMWQPCTQHSDCYWGRTCGNCTKYKGNEESQQTSCDTEEGMSPSLCVLWPTMFSSDCSTSVTTDKYRWKKRENRNRMSESKFHLDARIFLCILLYIL
jgi:hypothetical protein